MTSASGWPNETVVMPEKKIMERVRKDREAGKAPTTQAGEFVRDEMEKVGKGDRRVRSRKQAVAIGLSKARRAGVELTPPKKGETSSATRRKAMRDTEKGREQKKTESGHSSGNRKSHDAPVSRKRVSARSRAALSRRTRAQRMGATARTKARASARR